VVDKFKVYTRYINNYDNTMNTYGRCLKISGFVSLIEQCRDHADVQGHDLLSFLILPVQRIPRYSLLLRELLKHTWSDHVDYADLEYSLKRMEDVANYLNDKKAEAENISKVNEVWNKISGLPLVLSPDRRFVRNGEVRIGEKGGKERKLYLFNDTLIISKPKAFKKIKRKDRCNIPIRPHLSP